MVKETPNASPKNDVDNIRNILFGDQISQMDERFAQIERSINQLRAENRNLREALEAEVTQRESAFQSLQELIVALDKKNTVQQTNQSELFSQIKKAIDTFQSKKS